MHSARTTEQMTRIVLIGSIVVNVLLLILLLISFYIVGNHHVAERFIIGFLVLLYLGITSAYLRHNKTMIAAWMLVLLYGGIGAFTLFMWGLNAPVGILLLSFVILLSSVLLGARYILGITSAIIMVMTLVQFLYMNGVSQPDISGLDDSSTFGDVATYAIIFGILALISWLSGMRMEKTLKRAVEAESDLAAEKNGLALKLAEQTKDLRLAHEKELKQLYVFAELGQLTTIILHELANQISILSLDIDDLRERHQSSLAVTRARESIFYIDTIIGQVRNQIKESDDIRHFDASQVIRDLQKYLHKKLSNSTIKLRINDSQFSKALVLGDPFRLSQALTILVTNAYQANIKNDSQILLTMTIDEHKVNISVKDFGTGITVESRQSLFEPMKSSKGSGMGIGLYITKQIIVNHFKGKISLNPSHEYTQFDLELPRSKT
jgi:signal transduction histidine kinase